MFAGELGRAVGGVRQRAHVFTPGMRPAAAVGIEGTRRRTSLRTPAARAAANNRRVATTFTSNTRSGSSRDWLCFSAARWKSTSMPSRISIHSRVSISRMSRRTKRSSRSPSIPLRLSRLPEGEIVDTHKSCGTGATHSLGQVRTDEATYVGNRYILAFHGETPTVPPSRAVSAVSANHLSSNVYVGAARTIETPPSDTSTEIRKKSWSSSSHSRRSTRRCRACTVPRPGRP